MKKRMLAAILAAGAVVLSAAGCSVRNQTENTDDALKGMEENPAVTEVNTAFLPTEGTYENEEEKREFMRNKQIPEDFAAAYREFCCLTGSEFLKAEEKNAIYSPLSLYYCLALAAEGAAGETREEILSLLRYEDMEALTEDCKKAYEFFYRGEPGKVLKKEAGGEPHSRDVYRLELFQSVWADDGLTLKDSFKETAVSDYYSDIFRVDFADDATYEAMEDWVELRTRGIIRPEIQPSDDIEAAILGTVYFYDEWTDVFRELETKPDTFTKSDGSQVTCDFMNRTMGSHGFRRGENYTSSQLALKNGSVEFILPDPGVDVHTFLESPEVLNDVLFGTGESTVGEVVWKVPKFSYGSELSLKEPLLRLGMKKAFDDADFTNMASDPLFISSIRQQCHVGIDENGVEAAAYTEIMYAGAALPQGRAEMILDRPFLYVIKNRGEILFIGICEDPTV